MSKRDEKGFSLIELLIVVVVIGIVSSLAVPAVRKALSVAEDRNMFATMRVISSAQVSYYSQNNRFARLSEINNFQSGGIGTPSGPNDLMHGKYVLSMIPPSPTPTELKQGYTIKAMRNLAGENIIYEYALTQSGEIVQLQP